MMHQDMLESVNNDNGITLKVTLEADNVVSINYIPSPPTSNEEEMAEEKEENAIKSLREQWRKDHSEATPVSFSLNLIRVDSMQSNLNRTRIETLQSGPERKPVIKKQQTAMKEAASQDDPSEGISTKEPKSMKRKATSKDDPKKEKKPKQYQKHADKPRYRCIWVEIEEECGYEGIIGHFYRHMRSYHCGPSGSDEMTYTEMKEYCTLIPKQ